MNVIAGILIGIANKSWLARILVPFVWGFIFYFYVIFFKGSYYDRYLEKNKDRRLKWGMKPRVSFFFIEYMTALTTSFIFSIASGFVFDLIMK